MDNDFSTESMRDIYVYETAQNIEQLEKSILLSEKAGCFPPDTVNEIFRIMHTIKGSSAMMLFNGLASLAHAVEDLFYFIREERPEHTDCALLSDLVLEGVDFIKLELEKVKAAKSPDGDPSGLIGRIKGCLASIQTEKDAPRAHRADAEAFGARRCDPAPGRGAAASGQRGYEAVVYFDEGCEMENIRSYAIIHNMGQVSEEFCYFPEDIVENNESARVIREQGFRVVLRSDKSLQELHDFFMSAAFVRNLELAELEDDQVAAQFAAFKEGSVPDTAAAIPEGACREPKDDGRDGSRGAHQSIISVDVAKLDKLMDLMGEMVIAEAMVTQNPELASLRLNSFHKAARQLKKITGEMQDMVMSIRMVPLSATFHKMFRIVRDMERKLGKEVELKLIGEETEVDKNIIEHISDPLMHLVRNAVDHGIEPAEERLAAGKPQTGRITLEAENAGSDVLVTVRDDGRGLDRKKILQKASEHGLIHKPESEMTEKEVLNMIFLPGFTTNDSVTEFSGRGVGMDVVTRNLEAIGGSVSVESAEGAGTVTTMKIPLTLAIIDGMNIRVGAAKYTIPTTSIQETFRVRESDLITDPDGNEMMMVRGQCYPILRLHKLYAVESGVTDFTKGIMLMVEQDGKSLCLFADELLGQHQVVVKTLPAYIKNTRRVDGLSGCTLLGDGSISLILNIGGLIGMCDFPR